MVEKKEAKDSFESYIDSYLGEIEETLSIHPHLEQIRFRYPDGESHIITPTFDLSSKLTAIRLESSGKNAKYSHFYISKSSVFVLENNEEIKNKSKEELFEIAKKHIDETLEPTMRKIDEIHGPRPIIDDYPSYS